MSFPIITGGPHDDFLRIAYIFHFNSTDDQVFCFLDDHILQRDVFLLDFLSELQIGTCWLPKVHHPLLLGHRTDHSLCNVSQKLQTPYWRHVGGFLHYAHLCQLTTLIVREDDLLLVPMFIVGIRRTVEIDRSFLVGSKIFWSDY